MRDLVAEWMPLLLSAVTIWMNLAAGHKYRNAWAIGLGNQALWLIWIVASAKWNFLPMNLFLWGVYFYNHLRWRIA